jgi:ATP-dependent DNA ligase
MVEPLRHRQTKGAETDMFDLQPLRHISTLPEAAVTAMQRSGRYRRNSGRALGTPQATRLTEAV